MGPRAPPRPPLPLPTVQDQFQGQSASFVSQAAFSDSTCLLSPPRQFGSHESSSDTMSLGNWTAPSLDSVHYGSVSPVAHGAFAQQSSLLTLPPVLPPIHDIQSEFGLPAFDAVSVSPSVSSFWMPPMPPMRLTDTSSVLSHGPGLYDPLVVARTADFRDNSGSAQWGMCVTVSIGIDV